MRKIGSFLIILILLPCVITVFMNGVNLAKDRVSIEQYVEVVNEEQTVIDGKSKTEGENSKLVLWEEYLIGMLAADIPEDYEIEAIKAQAVLLRSQAALQLTSEISNVLQASYLPMEELKRRWDAEKFENYYKKYKTAVDETKREVLMYQEAIAYTPFHNLSTGITRSGPEALGDDTYPYLVNVDCSEDKEAEEAMQMETFSYEEVKEKCLPFLVAVEKNEADKAFTFDDFEIISKDAAGYVLTLNIAGNAYSGEQFRQALNLPSSAFSLQDYKGELRITTSGCGHGLGMSQWTANEMAKNGASYQEILAFFFPETNIQKDNEIFLKLE